MVNFEEFFREFPRGGRRQNEEEEEDSPSDSDGDEAESSEDEGLVGNAIGAAVRRLVPVVKSLTTVLAGLQDRLEQQDEHDSSFALSPLSVEAQSAAPYIDYSTKAGRKHYEHNVAPLFAKEEFDVEPERLPALLTVLEERTGVNGWRAEGGLLMIPEDPTRPQVGPWIDSVRDYGLTTMESIRAWETTFIHTKTRLAQESHMLFVCLKATLSTTGMDRINVWKAEWQIKIEGIVYNSGGCLLKVIIRESYLDSNATVLTLRRELQGLGQYIKDNGTDLTKFHRHVRSLMDGLKARGHKSEDLMLNLFDAYNACTDEDFLQYIKRIQHEYQDGTLDEQNFTPDSLMVRANNFYKMRMSTSSGRGWEEPSEKDAQILALQTQLVKTQRESNKIKAQIKFTGGAGGDKSPKNPKPAWLKNNIKPSKATLTKPKAWNGRQWYWCDKSTGGKCNGRWVCHLPSECEGGKRKDKSNSSESEKKKKARKMLNLQQATIDADAEADS